MNLAMLFYFAGGDIEDVGASFILFVLFVCILITIGILIISALVILKVLDRKNDKLSKVKDDKKSLLPKD